MTGKLLLFAYFYPPLGGPAVQRPLKLVKYLNKFGWETDVISVKDIVYHSRDESFLDEDKARSVYRTKSRDAMASLKKATNNSSEISNKIYFKTPEFLKRVVRDSFFIDDKIGWLPFALKAGRELCRSNKYDAVMATIGPYTSGIAAYKISKEFNLPFIIDYRDHWNIWLFKSYLTPLHRLHALMWERKILNQATIVSVVGRIIGEELAARFGDKLATKMQVMYNGWDEADYTKSVVNQSREKIQIRYVGNFYSTYSPEYFIKAMEELYRTGDLPEDIEFTFVGNYYREVRDMLLKVPFHKQMKIISQVEHPVAIEYVTSSDGMLLFIAPFGSKGVICGKLFEYLRGGKEILSMLSLDGEAAEILKKSGYDLVTAFDDINSIKQNFLKFYRRIKAKKLDVKPVDAIYNRENQTKLFVQRLEREIGRSKKKD